MTNQIQCLSQPYFKGNKQSGIVLIATILLISVLSLLVLSQMKLVFLDYQTLNQLAERHQLLFELEEKTKKLISDLSQPNACLIKTSDPNEVIHLLKNKQGCILVDKNQQFFYLMEDLGIFPCLQTKINGIRYSTQHLRISNLVLKPHPVILQIRVAIPVKLETCTNNESILIRLGFLSWRYLF